MGSVLVTGSTGNLGQKAVAALESAESTKVVRFGRNSANLPDVVTADLSHYGSWARSFGGVDAVLHLAADPRPVSDWAAVTKLNIDLALNVFRAAEEAQVRRIVFASSNWVVAGYRFGRERLTSCIPPRPVNPYGASKLFIERAGIALGERTGISVLALRIGWCQPGDNIPGPHMGFGGGARNHRVRPEKPSYAATVSQGPNRGCGGTDARPRDPPTLCRATFRNPLVTREFARDARIAEGRDGVCGPARSAVHPRRREMRRM